MLLVPKFFVRTSVRILLLQSFFAWLCLKLDKLPLSTPVNIAIGTTIGVAVNTLKETLDANLGFVLPWDSPYFLPMLLDEYILTTMPELAVLLGESPCSTRIARLHPQTGVCEPELAYACSQHAVAFESGKLGLEFLNACYEDYGVSPTQAQKHHKRCHNKSWYSNRMNVLGCTRAKQQIERNKEICFYIPPVIDCTMQYSNWEDLRPLLQSGGSTGDEHLERAVCNRRVVGDMYIDGRFQGWRPQVTVTSKRT